MIKTERAREERKIEKKAKEGEWKKFEKTKGRGRRIFRRKDGVDGEREKERG
jgi:hypothetical protein